MSFYVPIAPPLPVSSPCYEHTDCAELPALGRACAEGKSADAIQQVLLGHLHAARSFIRAIAAGNLKHKDIVA